jgi:2-amino-4-hydroxy-6-hydroxymethyldihydropteridine diphosphokinase
VEVETKTAYIGLGSNLGDRAGNLLLAVRGLLEASIKVHRLSAIYETEPVGIDYADNFLNMVAEVSVTNITPAQMLARMIRIEYLLGRRNKFENAPRTVDLDLLFFGDVHLDTPFLTLPHPRLHERKFVLVPMVELTPHFIHPVFQRTVQELLAETLDSSKVRRWNPNGETETKKFINQQIHTSFPG